MARLTTATVIIIALVAIAALVSFGPNLASRPTIISWPGGQINIAQCRDKATIGGQTVLVPLGLIKQTKALGRQEEYCRLFIDRSQVGTTLADGSICLIPTQQGKINLLGRLPKNSRRWPDCLAIT